MPFVNRIGSGATRKFGFGTGVKPGAPTIGTATRGDQQASVAFTEPAVLGTGAPTYTATSSPGSFTGTGSSSPVVVTGLTNGTAYTFTVTASNSFGSSTSGSSNSVIPAGVPVAPDAPTPTAGNASVSLSWTAPSANGSAITDYKIYYATSVGGTYTLFSDTVSTNTSVTVTGLTNGTAYFFKVAAVNAVGDSALSAASTSSTPAAPPFFPFFPSFDPCAGNTCTGDISYGTFGPTCSNYANDGCFFGGNYEARGPGPSIAGCSCGATYANLIGCAAFGSGVECS